MLEQFDTWAQHVGVVGYLLLGLAAFLEYVFPPFPGDSVLLAGGLFAVRGEKSVVLLFAAVTLGSVAGLSLDYAIGRWVGKRVELQPDGRLFFGLTHARIAKAQAAMRKRGSWLLVANRFLPAFRAVIFIAAGASGMPYRKVVTLGVLSAMGWNVLLLGVGMAVGGRAEKLEQWLQDYQRVAFGLLGAAALAFVGVLLWKRARR